MNYFQILQDCFNTDNGIRRATICYATDKDGNRIEGFNTDNGIRRATIPTFYALPPR